MTNSHKININTKKISKKARNNSRLYKKKFRTFSKTIDTLLSIFYLSSKNSFLTFLTKIISNKFHLKHID